MSLLYELLYTIIENNQQDSKSQVKILGRRIPFSSIILSVLVLALLASNLYLIKTKNTQREHLIDSLALAQNGYEYPHIV
jgi:hypothetical protein